MSGRPSEAPSGRSPLRGAARERAILDAALELVSEVGYERVTCDAIAARARASKATIYRRWPDKAALVADALGRHTEDEPAQAPDTGSLRQDLVQVVGDLARSLAPGGAGPSVIDLLERLRDDSGLRDSVAGQVRRRARTWGRALGAQAQGRGERVPAEAAERAIDLAFGQLLTETLLTGQAPASGAQARLVDEVLLPVLRASGSPDA